MPLTGVEKCVSFPTGVSGKARAPGSGPSLFAEGADTCFFAAGKLLILKHLSPSAVWCCSENIFPQRTELEPQDRVKGTLSTLLPACRVVPAAQGDLSLAPPPWAALTVGRSWVVQGDQAALTSLSALHCFPSHSRSV